LKAIQARFKVVPTPKNQPSTSHNDEIGGFGLRIRESGSRTPLYQYKTAPEPSPDARRRSPEALANSCKHVADLQAQVRLGQESAAAKEVGPQ
jgi:hypothetical protein